MAKKQKKKKKAKPEAAQVKDFLDMIAPAAVRFNTDSSVLGSSCRCTLALRSYPASTGELALLSHLGEKSGVLLHIYIRQVPAAEEDAILHNAQNKNRMDRSSTSNMKQSITAEANLQDVETLIATMRRNKEPLVHCAVFIELCARDVDSLRSLRDDVTAMLTRSKLGADRIFLRQREGFLAVNPAGDNVFGILYERVLPASSAANLFPFNYSGKNDPHGFYIGKDRYGSNIILDLDRRAEDKTNANVLILGNSGQGKSFLLKLLLCNILASGKSAICLDAEHEQDCLCKELNGCFADIMSGQYIINPLEPKLWNEEGEDDPDAPAAFRQRTRLSQHISFLKDFFRAYKDFDHRQIDTIELMLERLYQKWGLNDHTDFRSMRPSDYPTLSDLYDVIEDAYQHYDREENPLYPRELLQEVLLGLHSLCRGAESKFFNGHTNITSHRFLVFGVKELLHASAGVKNAMLFNLLSYLSDKLLTEGNTAAALDELYIWLSNPTAVEYIRNTLKRVRKKESSLIMASQNLEDFDAPGVREMTRPLFAIPTHQFLFNAGSVDRRFYMHVQQGDRETYQIEKRYGKRPTAFLDELGYLDSSLIAVHLTDCTDEEAAHIARKGASMIVNPGSIGIIDGIVCPSVAFQEAGGSVALGSDQAPGNNCHNIINEMKNVALFNKIKYGNPEVMPAWRALRMATIEGAQAIGLGDSIGSLEPGKQADFIAIDLNCPSMLPVYTYPMRNMIPNLVYSARGPEVALAAVDGEIIMRDGVFTKVDQQEYLSAIPKYPDDIGQRAAKEFFEIDGTNAHFMRDGKL